MQGRRTAARRFVIELDDAVEYEHLQAVLKSLRALRRRLAPPSPSPSPSPVSTETAAATGTETESDSAAPQLGRRPTLPVGTMEVP